MLRLLGFGATTGRQKFVEERHEEIQALAKTLADDINAGGKFRKAGGILWAKEDHSQWDAAVAAELNEDIDWAE